MPLIHQTRTAIAHVLHRLGAGQSPAAAAAHIFGATWVGCGRQDILENVIRAPLPRQRAAIALALVAGMQVMRQMMGMQALAQADPADLEQILIPVMRALFETA